MRPLLLLLIVLAAAAPADAKIGIAPLSSMSVGADLVMVANVERVLELEGGPRIAEVAVTKRVKGSPAGKVWIHAQGTWICDGSTAVEGETALWFLARYEIPNEGEERRKAREAVTGTKDLYLICHSGCGRMPVETVGGESWVSVNVSNVQLPDEVETVPGPDPRYAAFIRSARLEDMIKAVRRRLSR